jgi:vacuolar-type H+-ATPase subunit F/Vma7
MGLLVVLGEAARVEGFALGGATVIPAEGPDAVRRAWESLPDDVAVVVLTGQAADALQGRTTREVPSVVMAP